jgi:hypothetical protein
MDELRRRRVLWLAGTMLSAYAASALLFAIGFGLRRGWGVDAAVVALAVGMAASALIRPAASGMEVWWTHASRLRRASNVATLLFRVAAVLIVARVAVGLEPR